MQLLSGSGIFFGIMAKTIEEHPVDYFVCQGCGSTLVELPARGAPSAPARSPTTTRWTRDPEAQRAIRHATGALWTSLSSRALRPSRARRTWVPCPAST
jgi:hypothetical protein